MGFSRLTLEEQTDFAPQLINCLDGKPQQHQDKYGFEQLGLLKWFRLKNGFFQNFAAVYSSCGWYQHTGESSENVGTVVTYQTTVVVYSDGRPAAAVRNHSRWRTTRDEQLLLQARHSQAAEGGRAGAAEAGSSKIPLYGDFSRNGTVGSFDCGICGYPVFSCNTSHRWVK